MINTVVSFSIFVAVTVLLVFQLSCLRNNITTIELNNEYIRCTLPFRRVKVLDNFKEIFGDSSFGISWLLPTSPYNIGIKIQIT